jgi:tetratricopeptide (TPR) repeat protein
MILNIISTTQGKKPIYFAVTVSNENMIGLRSYLTMEGLAFRLRPVKGELIDPVQMRKSMMERFEGHYRNLNNPKVHFNDNIVKLLQNYRSGFLQLAYYYYQRNEPGKEPGRNTPLSEQYAEFDSLSSKAKVNLILRWMEKDIPEKVIPINNDEITLQIGRMYFDCGYPEELEKRIDELAGKTRDWQKKLSYAAMLYQWLRNESKATMILEKTLNEVKDNDEARVNIASLMGRMNKTELALKILDEVLTHRPNNEIMLNIASAYYSMRQDTLALKLYEELVAKNSNDGQAMGGLLSVYERLGEYQKALEMVEKWLQLHPQDTQAQKQKELYQRMVSGGTKATPLFPQIGIKPAGIRPLKKSPLK